jgi:hypothetical protein
MQAGPLAVGQCTWGVYWAPPSDITHQAELLCNETDGPVLYVATWDDLEFQYPVKVCSTAQGFNGKPCAVVRS